MNYLRISPYSNNYLPIKPPKRKVFISFHHKNDQGWFDLFTRTFSQKYDIFHDKSINDTRVRSDDPEYIDRAIREDYIKGSSLTIILCGSETHNRKYVDWEINSTLNYKHALLGIILPTAFKNHLGKIIVPDRFYNNVTSGYAHYEHWHSCTSSPESLKMAIEFALLNSKNNGLIKNSMTKMKRNI